ncbi:DUF3450 domain-containing protein [Agarivorans sp. Alg241-V36]|uniref:DUF3450 domain-containing protein n=1 Tax=Agarivorans sp. Alg241-V36 TaxID=2305992 RepID=UPI0013D43F91|nr:DUF3450 domain-containing protein [Agarivorans sp. Alg241-V36]
MFSDFLRVKRLILATCLIASFSFSTQAEQLNQARDLEGQIIDQAKHSQQRIDKSSDEALALDAEIQALEREINQLSIYKNHLERLVESQQAEQLSLESQLTQIDSTRLGVVPMMYQMLDGLAELQSQDLPIRTEQRQQRLANLNALMSQADISDSEKYRRILEAYQIELDYGLKLGSYEAQIELDGLRQVELLNLGRVSLIARSLDHQHYWAWSQNQQQWQALANKEHNDARIAFDVAHKVAAPSLLTLPLAISAEELK